MENENTQSDRYNTVRMDELQSLENFARNFDLAERTIFLHLMKDFGCKVTTSDAQLRLAFFVLEQDFPIPKITDNKINRSIDYARYAEELGKLFRYDVAYDYHAVDLAKIKQILSTRGLESKYDELLSSSHRVYRYEAKTHQATSLLDFEDDDIDHSKKAKTALATEIDTVDKMLREIYANTEDKKVKRITPDNLELFRHFLYYLIQQLKNRYVSSKCYSDAVYATFWGDRPPHIVSENGILEESSWGSLGVEDIIFYLSDRYKTNLKESEYSDEIPKLIERGYTEKSAKVNTIGTKFDIKELSAALSTLITLSAMEYCKSQTDVYPITAYAGGFVEEKKYKLNYAVRLLLYHQIVGNQKEDIVVSAFVDYKKTRVKDEINDYVIKNQNDFLKAHANKIKFEINEDKDGKSYSEIERIVGTSLMAKKDRAKMNGIYTRVLIYNIERLMERYINDYTLPYFVPEPYSPGLTYGEIRNKKTT